MKALITGAAGFIGHHFLRYVLENTDWEIVTIDRLDHSGSQDRIASVVGENQWNRVKHLWHDLKAPINSRLDAELDGVSCVFHIAAASHVQRSIYDPLSFVMDNVVGTCHLLEWARHRDVRFIYLSTDEVFGPAPPGVHYQEESPHRPSNPYAASKAAAEDLAWSFHVTYGLPVVIIRSMNVVGIRQHPEKVVPRFVRLMLRREPVTVHVEYAADGTMVIGSRHYIDVDDLCSALVLVADRGSGRYNAPGPVELSNLEVACCVAEGLGLSSGQWQIEYVPWHRSRPGHDPRYAMSGRRLRDELQWTAVRDPRQSIAETARWYAAHGEKWLLG